MSASCPIWRPRCRRMDLWCLMAIAPGPRAVGEQVYIDLLNRAQRSVCIMTPHLILDGELENALCFAAERGVKVKMILPGVPDKSFAYALAKTHYAGLLASGWRSTSGTPRLCPCQGVCSG